MACWSCRAQTSSSCQSFTSQSWVVLVGSFEKNIEGAGLVLTLGRVLVVVHEIPENRPPYCLVRAEM